MASSAEPPPWLAAWCADASGLWVDGRAINPCALDSALLALLVTLGFATVIMNAPSLSHAAHLRRAGGREKGPVGISGDEFGLIMGASFAFLMHAIHLGSAVLMHLAPSHIAMHAALLVVWLAITWATVYVSKVHVMLDFRPLTGAVSLFYLWSLTTFWSLYRVTTDYPLAYQRSTIWSLMLWSVVSILLLVLDWIRHKPANAEGYEPLPGASDVEAGGGKVSRIKGPDAAGGRGGGPQAALDRMGSATLVDPDNRLSWLTIFVESFETVWPENGWLKLRMISSIFLLLAVRGLNLLVPIFYKRVVDTASSLAGGGGPDGLIFGWLSPWVVAYLVAIFFQGGAGGGMMGALNNLRQVLWLPVSQDAFKRTTLRVFTHMLDLDLSFHLSRKTGEITKQVERGTNAIQNMLSTILFNIVPTLIDLLTASTYLAQAMEPSIAVTVFLTVGSYIPVTIIITEWRSSLRRDMNRTDQAVSARLTDALLNFETVKYFTNESHEEVQLEGAIKEYQRAEFKGMASLNLLNMVQSFIMWIGIAIGLLFCNLGLKRGELTVGDMVLFLSLMGQLLAPLNWFGSFYRTIQQYVIDYENLYALLQQRSRVSDKPGCKELIVTDARVEYEDVSFHYDPNAPVLKNVSFSVPGGQTVAFVGATGSGKSTITRLMFRFYDVAAGAIRVDGQDIRNVSQSSLRRAVGMVPQDTVLFNDTILMNIRYGRLDATDEEVFAAAEAACIHEAVTTRFPKGYQTMVGERGLKLSGGEKQRVAFARALLKNPAILVLDEATSALDTLTERKIQSALASLRSSRTTMIVAHRLSTIVDADVIVAMHLGEVKEVGSHNELLAKTGGLYSELWHKQLTTHDGVEVGGAPGTSKVPALPVSLSASASSVSLASQAAEEGDKGKPKRGLFGFGGGSKK